MTIGHAETPVWRSRLADLARGLPACPIRASDAQGRDAAREPRRRDEAFATEAFLADLLAGPGPVDAQAVRVLDRLCKKVDVVGKVSAFYTPALARSAEPEPLSAPYAAALAAALLLAAETGGDLKFLNTALKMLDGRLGDPRAAYPPWLAEWAEALLARPWSAFRRSDPASHPHR